MFNRQSIHIALLLWGCIFSLIAATCIFMSKNFHKEKRRWILCMLLATAVLLFSDAIAWGYRGAEGNIGFYAVHISNFFVFLFSDIIMAIFHRYVCCCLFHESDTKCTAKTRIEIKVVYLLALTAAALVILTQFTGFYYTFDIHNRYQRSMFYPGALILPMLGMLIDMHLIIQYRKQISKPLAVSLLSYIFLPFIAALIQMFYYGISMINIAISISMILMFIEAMIEQAQTVVRQERKISEQKLELAKAERRVSEQNREIAERDKELTEAKIATMISQIKPHFIYNTLGSIEQLCELNPELAAEMTHNFAKYLRGNFGELGNTKPIRLSQEILHCKYYVSIEQMRFPDMTITFDLQSKDFLIPALSVQPLIENAIKHGLMKLPIGGEILVSSYETDSMFCVKVEDNGAGFNLDNLKNDGKHIGLTNIRGRLKTMCNGSLVIESKPGIGTKVLIQIPKGNEEEKDESNSCR